MQLFLQRLIDGTANGVLYGASALALVVVYRASGRLNLAQGELATVGTYVSLVLGTPATPALFGTTFVGNWIAFSPWPLWAGIVGGMIVAAALAAVIERFVVRRIPETSARTAVSVSIGLLLLINSLIVYFWKNAPRGYPSPFPDAPDDYFGFFGARLRYTTLMTWAVLLAVLGILNLVLRVSKAGLAFRAVSSNPAASRLVGINTGRVLAGGWALAAALGTLCGGLLISRLVLRPGVLTQLLIYSFAAATIGGLTSLGGALVGGLIVGISITMIGAYVPFVGTSMALPAVLVLMVVMLLVRPSGLFGTVGIDGGPATTTRLLGGGSDAGPDASAARFVLVRGTSRWRIVRLVGVVAVLAGAVLPAVVLPFVEARLWTDVLIYAIALAGLYLLMGPGGQLSLGHGAFVGVGAYATAVSITRWGWPHLAGLALGFVICLVIGLAVGLPALRIKGQYLALVTLAFAVAFPGVIERFAWLTGGGQGPAPAPDLKPPSWLGIPESNRVLWLHLVVTATGALVVFALTNLSRSAVGRAIRATAEDEVAAAAMGVPVVRVRTMMFGVAAAISGLAGGLLALEIRAVSTSQFTVPFSLMLYAAIVFGGADRLLGAFLGALLVVVMPWLQVEMGWKISPDMLYGALLLAGVAALPLGAAPWLADRARRLVAVVEAPPGDRDYTVPRRRPAAGPVAALDAGDQRADEGDSPVEVIPL